MLDDHLKALNRILGPATSITIAVAFLNLNGLGRIVEMLRQRLTAGAVVEMFVGTDFCQTDPKALKELLALSIRYPRLTLWLAKPNGRSTFHPKIYLGVEGKTSRVMIGSANLTGGALGGNEEISLVWEVATGHPVITDLQVVFLGYRNDDRCEELDEIVLEQYRRRFKIAEDAKKRVEKEIAESDSENFDLAKLLSLHAEFSEDRDEAKALEKRRRDRRTALNVQRKIAGMAENAKLSDEDLANFKTLFRDLVTSGDGHRHLWHSGDIHRRGQEALSNCIARSSADISPPTNWTRATGSPSTRTNSGACGSWRSTRRHRA